MIDDSAASGGSSVSSAESNLVRAGSTEPQVPGPPPAQPSPSPEYDSEANDHSSAADHPFVVAVEELLSHLNGAAKDQTLDRLWQVVRQEYKKLTGRDAK